MVTVFIAGATGFTGRAISHIDAESLNLDLILHVRPNSNSHHLLANDPRVREAPLDEPDALAQAMRPATVVIQLIGTTKRQFTDEISYETVDYQTTEQLLAAAKVAKIEHFILLSSALAQTSLGEYLTWKQRTEELVTLSQIPYTIVRPGAITGNQRMRERLNLDIVSNIISKPAEIPLLHWLHDLRPMNVDILAKILLYLATQPAKNAALNPKDLWQIAKQANF